MAGVIAHSKAIVSSANVRVRVTLISLPRFGNAIRTKVVLPIEILDHVAFICSDPRHTFCLPYRADFRREHMRVFGWVFRLCLRMTASENPASLNSLRKATPSLAPAIHANQFVSPSPASGGNGLERINSAPNTVPPRLTTRASSRKIASLAGFRLNIPLTMATSISSSAMGNCSAPDSRNSRLLTPLLLLDAPGPASPC